MLESATGEEQFPGGCAGLRTGKSPGGGSGGVHVRRAGGDWLGTAQTSARDIHDLRMCVKLAEISVR